MRKRLLIGGAAAIPVVFVAVFLAFTLVSVLLAGSVGSTVMAMGGAVSSEKDSPCAPIGVDPAAGGPTLNVGQTKHIRNVIGIAKTMGIPRDGQIISVMVMMQESAIQSYANSGKNILNNHSGWPSPGEAFWLDVAKLSLAMPHEAVGNDSDSVGLFQQRPSMGWGDTDTSKAIDDPSAAVARLLDDRWAAQAFFGGTGGSANRGLLEVAGWQTMDKGSAAQSVQGSAFPYAYSQHESTATALVDANQDAPAIPLMDPAGAGAGTPGLCGGVGALRGIVSRSDISKSANPRNDALAGFVIEMNWAELEPSRGVYQFQGIRSGLDWAAANGKRVRLRVQPGDGAPQWAKDLDGGAIPWRDHDKDVDTTTGRFWLDGGEYQKAWQDLQTALAAAFDGDPALAEVNICGAGSMTCEVFLLQLEDRLVGGDKKTNREHLLEAGFTDAARDKAIATDNAFMGAAWTSTYLTLWVHPYFTLTGVSQSKALEIADAAFFANPRIVLGHTGADELSTQPGKGTNDLYTHFLDAGEPFTLQTRTTNGGFDGAHPLGDLAVVVKWAADSGVLAVELPHGWEPYLTDDEISEANTTMGAYAGATGTAAAVIAAAQKWLGTPYSWGGGSVDGPTEGFAQGTGIIGFDCSSLVQYAVYNGMGRVPAAMLPRVAADQFALPSGTVMLGYNPSAWQPGDLLFWGSSAGSIHHVAIYIGNGLLINAPKTGDVVKIVPVWQGDFYAAKRLAVLSGA